MKFTTEEIALCKKLHELGVRKEIKYGDWFLFKQLGRGEDICLCKKHPETQSTKSYIIPLWTWADAREWLIKKGIFLEAYLGFGLVEKSQWRFWDRNKAKLFDIKGKTDLEAILKCMVEIAEK